MENKSDLVSASASSTASWAAVLEDEKETAVPVALQVPGSVSGSVSWAEQHRNNGGDGGGGGGGDRVFWDRGVVGRSDHSTCSPPDRSPVGSVPGQSHPDGGSAHSLSVSGKLELVHRDLLQTPPRTCHLHPFSRTTQSPPPLLLKSLMWSLLCLLTVLRGLKRRNHRRQ